MLKVRAIHEDAPPDDGVAPRRLRVGRAVAYGSGEAAFSVINNGLFGFALLFYTEALGLSASMAGVALSVSVFWEAVSEPLMGNLSDRTRTRFGSRYPWIAAGALLMAASFYAIWSPPAFVRGDQSRVFFYLVAANLVLRTGMTMFFIPYLALGFEIAPDYDDRTRLQGVRWVCNMVANFAGPGLVWVAFLGDRTLADGTVVKGTAQAAGYQTMGLSFAAAALVLTAVLLASCRTTAGDNRDLPRPPGSGLRGFWSHMGPIAFDREARSIYVLITLLVMGMVIFSSLQGYIYVHFLILSPVERSVVHGSTMAAAAIGALLVTPLARRLDKRGAAAAALGLGIFGLVGLAASFLTGWLPRSGGPAVAVFIVFQGLYWLASGALLPIATAMIGDVAELRRFQGRAAAEGGYAAMFSLMWRLGTSFSLLVSGWLLTAIGFDGASSAPPSSAVSWRLGAAACACGMAFYLVSLAWLARLRLDRTEYADRLGGAASTAEAEAR